MPPADSPSTYICNVVPSKETEKDWKFRDSVDSGVLGAVGRLPRSVDLREDWWTVADQEDTGSCVGWASADGVARWHLTKAGKISPDQRLSARHVWMASKETDRITTRPESFLEEAGTMLKSAMKVLKKHGAALETDLPFHIDTKMFLGSENAFYAGCAQRTLATYFNLELDLTHWKTWLAQNGPILAALQVDASWDNAAATGGKVDTFRPATVRGGHAIAIVGYRGDGRFIARNSWGTSWGDQGFAYLKPAYIRAAFFNESYGATL
ncbi:MAG TPA: C1 family peptidase [Nocardioides sp.]|uniref:C1 family peptidase n=1 Tax=Nocardioides sp. TaxID=35761 RepID=UPI002C5B68F1|nr:C1 family peptidase [Nocardioides sp.]HQR26219.1 C1 family peptidase [Nocardioides sp.]